MAVTDYIPILNNIFGAESAAKNAEDYAREVASAGLMSTVGPSAAADFQADPRFEAAQLQALKALLQTGAQRGLGPQDRYALQQIAQSQGQQERGAREALMAQAAQRGQLNAGNTLAAQLQNNSASANQAAMQGGQVLAGARERALAAMAQGGNLANTARAYASQEQLSKAKAIDAINSFNASQRYNAAINSAGANRSAADADVMRGQAVGNALNNALTTIASGGVGGIGTGLVSAALGSGAGSLFKMLSDKPQVETAPPIGVRSSPLRDALPTPVSEAAAENLDIYGRRRN